jgi:hypothetical protein
MSRVPLGEYAQHNPGVAHRAFCTRVQDEAGRIDESFMVTEDREDLVV